MSNKYFDFYLMEKYPNKYNFTPKSLKKLKILDWERLKQKTWLNKAMTSGTWWCHLEGCQRENQKYDEENEFWIGFNENNNEIDYYFTAFGGMCSYNFDKFYDMKFIENKYDMQVQVNAIKWLNMMIEEGILGKE